MDFMSILGRLLLLPIYVFMFFMALFSQANDREVFMGLCVLIGIFSWKITKPARVSKPAA